MRETSPPREIVVPSDMHGSRTAPRSAPRRTGLSRGGTVPRGAFTAALRACGTWIGGKCLANPGGTVGLVVACGAAVYVSLNALGFQDGRHPAPILPKPNAVAAAEPVTAKPPIAKPLPDAPKEKPESLASAKDAPHAPGRDAIGEVIRGADETTASVSLKADRQKADLRVMRAQRALTKLGYGSLKDDGVMGPSTKAAIEKFERDRKLPVKGEASGRTLRELATRAGLPPG